MLLQLDLCDIFFSSNVYKMSLIRKVSNNPKVVKHFLILFCREADTNRHEMLPKDFICPSFLFLHILCSSISSLLVSHLAPELWLEGISAIALLAETSLLLFFFFNCFFFQQLWSRTKYQYPGFNKCLKSKEISERDGCFPPMRQTNNLEHILSAK